MDDQEAIQWALSDQSLPPELLQGSNLKAFKSARRNEDAIQI